MKTDKLKKEITNHVDVLLGKVKPTDLKRWVSIEERQPTEDGYYIILRGDSNPYFQNTCNPAVHFWYNDKKEWSSETKYWLEEVKENEALKHLEAILDLAKCGCYHNYPDPKGNETSIIKHKLIDDAREFLKQNTRFR